MERTDILARWSPELLSILRIVTALLFLSHATAKFFGFPPVEMFADLKVLSLFGIAGIIELIGSVLLILGLFSRPTAFILSGEMAIAYWWEHAPISFFPILNYGESAVLFCFIFLYIAAAGPGPWSLDAVLRKA